MGLGAVPLSNETSVPPDVIVVDIPLWWKYIVNLSRHWAGNSTPTGSTQGAWWIDLLGQLRSNNYPLPELFIYHFPQSVTETSPWHEGGIAQVFKRITKMDFRDFAPIPPEYTTIGEAENTEKTVVFAEGVFFHQYTKTIWGYQYIIELTTSNVSIDWGSALTQIKSQYPAELFEIMAIVLHDPATGGNLDLGDFSGGGLDLETVRGIHNSPESVPEKLGNLSDMRWYPEFKTKPLFTQGGQTVSSNTVEQLAVGDI